MKQLKAFWMIGVLFTMAVFVNRVAYAVSPTIGPDETTVSCSGSYINNQDTDGATVQYIARWEPNIYPINLDVNMPGATAGNPTVLYTKYEHGWYTDANAETPFIRMNSIPSYSNYDFLGFWACVADNCEQIIDEDGYLMSGASTTVTTNLVAYWGYSCVATLHVGEDELCLYTEKVSDFGNPSLVIKISPTQKYYAAMSPITGTPKPISSTSTKKLYVKYGSTIYNVHDRTVH